MKILTLGFTNILSFASFGTEIDLWPLNKALALEKRLFLPRTNGQNLDIYEVSNITTQLIPSSTFSNLLEPDPNICNLVKPESISCILVPALAFDKNFFRLGYGKGFYDRLLSNCKITTLGVGYREQSTDILPISETDITLDNLLLF